MLEETRTKLLEMLTSALEENNLDSAETFAYCYKCLGDKEIEIHHIPLLIDSKEKAEEVQETCTNYLLKSLLGE